MAPVSLSDRRSVGPPTMALGALEEKLARCRIRLGEASASSLPRSLVDLLDRVPHRPTALGTPTPGPDPAAFPEPFVPDCAPPTELPFARHILLGEQSAPTLASDRGEGRQRDPKGVGDSDAAALWTPTSTPPVSAANLAADPAPSVAQRAAPEERLPRAIVRREACATTSPCSLAHVLDRQPKIAGCRPIGEVRPTLFARLRNSASAGHRWSVLRAIQRDPLARSPVQPAGRAQGDRRQLARWRPDAFARSISSRVTSDVGVTGYRWKCSGIRCPRSWRVRAPARRG